MFITNSTFHITKDKVIESGVEVSQKDLGISDDDVKRYIALGSLVDIQKPAKAVKPAEAEKTESPK